LIVTNLIDTSRTLKVDTILIIFIHQHNVVDNKTKICKTVTGL